MKIALLTPGGVDRSGTERVIPCLLALIERLVRLGHEVHVFAARQEPKPGQWSLLGASIHNAGVRPRGLRMLGALLRQHRCARFDVIHAFWAYSGAIGAIASRLTGAPLVLTLIGGDVVHLPEVNYGAQGSIAGRATLRIAARAATKITTETSAMARLARQLGIDARVVTMGVDLERWPASPPHRRTPENPLRLLHVGNLNRVKDQPTLLHAAALLRDAKVQFELDIVGLDTLGGEIHQLARHLNLGGDARFHGFLRQTALRPFFERADVLVVSSRHEGAPLVFQEAAVVGVPTVGTAVGHIADQAPEAAVAVPVGDAPALGEALIAIARDEPRRLRIAEAAQSFALSHDADYTVRTFVEIYRSVAGK